MIAVVRASHRISSYSYSGRVSVRYSYSLAHRRYRHHDCPILRAWTPWYNAMTQAEYVCRPVGLSTKNSQTKPMHRGTRSGWLLLVTLPLVLCYRFRSSDMQALKPYEPPRSEFQADGDANVSLVGSITSRFHFTPEYWIETLDRFRSQQPGRPGLKL